MKTIVLSLLLLISTDPREIAKINALKKEAQKAYSAGDYNLASERYALLDSMGVNDPALKLNLAHSYYQLKDTTGAKSNYQSVLNSSHKKLRSIAYQQLGVMDKEVNKLEEALQNLKSSLKMDPTNTGARYDYEVVKKLLEEQKKQEQEQEDQEKNQEDEENKDQQDQEENSDEKKEGDENEEQENEEGEKEESEEEKDGEKEEGENEEGEEQESEEEPTPEEQMEQKLEEMNISKEKAEMILEAMRNNEVQYLQQQRRKATKRPESGKPDW